MWRRTLHSTNGNTQFKSEVGMKRKYKMKYVYEVYEKIHYIWNNGADKLRPKIE